MSFRGGKKPQLPVLPNLGRIGGIAGLAVAGYTVMNSLLNGMTLSVFKALIVLKWMVAIGRLSGQGWVGSRRRSTGRGRT